MQKVSSRKSIAYEYIQLKSILKNMLKVYIIRVIEQSNVSTSHQTVYIIKKKTKYDCKKYKI